ncbi:sulfite oxidase subunit YedZ [Pasteurella multocida subsp. multocida OH4807]|nr:sulfite oxidase subunit YedZ [Pasteurella multocida subsp. multocida OH4807]
MLNLLRIVTHISCAIPFIWLHIILFSGDESQLGADPVKEMQHFLGFTAITILLLVFVFGIIFRLFKLYHLQILRRALGLWAWFYVILHIYAYFAFELGSDVQLFLHELIQRGYLIVGGGAFLILTLMSISSLPYIKNRMGKWWFYLHKLGYYALLFGAIHYYWSIKNLTFNALLYLVLSVFIVLWECYTLFRSKKAHSA